MKQIIKDYVFIAIGAFLIALGMTLFLVPIQLSSGGVGALGTVFFHTLQIPVWVTNLVFNAALFILGFKLLGKGSVLKTAVGILLLSVFLAVCELIPVFTNDLIICVACGGALVGIGVGLVVRAGGSTGGSDFAGLMIKGWLPHISIATTILVIDVAVIAISAIVFKSYEVMFYSSLAMLISSKLTDFILNMGESAKSLFIMSDKIEEIEKIVLDSFERGATELYSRGSYSGKDKPTLLCVLSPKEAPKLIKEIKLIDPFAFVVIHDAREVFGLGFKS